MAHQCKKCNKVTRKKKTKLGIPRRKYRCQGCGGFDFEDIADAFVTVFDYEDFLYPEDAGYDNFEDSGESTGVVSEDSIEVSEDRFVGGSDDQPASEQPYTSPEPAYTPPEPTYTAPEPDRSSSYGSSSYGSDSGGYDSGSSDCGSSDCGGCD